MADKAEIIRGLRRSSLVDYPSHVATTIFTYTCNFDCPWCHNRALIDPTQFERHPIIPRNDILRFLRTRRGKISGVCVSGGEPTLWGNDLASLLSDIQREGFACKLDTNGTNPELVRELVKDSLVNFVALDIKNRFDRYGDTVGIPGFDASAVRETVSLLQTTGIDHQFRTTLVPGLVEKKEMHEVSRTLGEAIVFQEYRSGHHTFRENV